LSDLEPQFEEELPDDAVAIRGGWMKARDLQISAERYWVENGRRRGYALTVWCWPGHTAEQIAEAVGTERLPQPVLRKTTVGKLRAAGYPLEKSGGKYHYSLRLPDPPTPQDWVNLRRIFDLGQPNPVAKR
jgi:hypothetical protein